MKRCEACERRAKAIAEWMERCKEWAKHPFGPMPPPPQEDKQ